MAYINTHTVLYLTGIAALGQAFFYYALLGFSKKINEQLAWLLFQVLTGLGFISLALGASGEVPDFYVISALLVLGAYLARFFALAMGFGASLGRRSLLTGIGVILFIGVLFTWCSSLGAPLGSLETIIFLPLGVAAGLSAKYLKDQRIDTRSTAMRLISYVLWLECLVYGALALGALAGIGQDYIQLESAIARSVVLMNFVFQLILPLLWVLYSALEKQSLFGAIGSFPASTKTRSSQSLSRTVTETAASSVSEKKSKTIYSSEASDSHLTSKEIEVLRWVVAGKKNKEIADELQISEASVKVHKSRMTSKLGLKTMPELTQALQQIDGAKPSLLVGDPQALTDETTDKTTDVHKG